MINSQHETIGQKDLFPSLSLTMHNAPQSEPFWSATSLFARSWKAVIVMISSHAGCSLYVGKSHSNSNPLARDYADLDITGKSNTYCPILTALITTASFISLQFTVAPEKSTKL